MNSLEFVKKKLHTSLKLGGFNVRREFCGLIIEKLLKHKIDLTNNHHFDNCVKNLCSSLESQCLIDQSIEKTHIDKAIESCLNNDSSETPLTIIGAFDFPKLLYNVERKQYSLSHKKPKLLSTADSKPQMFIDRYTAILQRTKRNLGNKFEGRSQIKLELQTVDFLFLHSHISLDHILILGLLVQGLEDKYYLEDPSGIVQLDLSHAVYYGGFFGENCFVLVNGYYEDKIIKVSTVILPPGEEYKSSKPSFGNINYFGGKSLTALKDSIKLDEFLKTNKGAMFLFLSDVWLDHPLIFEKLEIMFAGYNPHPPVAFIFMGTFLSEEYRNDKNEVLKKLFSQLGNLINKFSNLIAHSQFIFIPGAEDPSISHVVPRLSLPSCVTKEINKIISKAIFTTNPCRIQYCTKEITVFRANLLSKFFQTSLHIPTKNEFSDSLTRTIVSQGHLVPLPPNALTVHWDFDYTLSLYPLPDLLVIGDKAEAYTGTYKGCQLINPGSFCESGFQFKAYIPFSNKIDDCML